MSDAYRTYWVLYGGWKALIRSRYLYIALTITAVTAPVWICKDGAETWAQAGIEILPSLMGFSIAGMAILLALSDPKTMRIITEEGEPRSFFAETMANFFHFIVIQAMALLTALLAKFYSFWPLSLLGVFLLSYSILVGLAMAAQLFQTSRIVNMAGSVSSSENEANRQDGEET